MGAESQLRRFGSRKQNKSPPVLSHEFIIQNHADIMSCVAMVFVVGLMLKATSPVAAVFVTLQHNTTALDEASRREEHRGAMYWSYVAGAKDLATIFFYSIMCVVVHAVLQEYVLDKVKNRLHLSKTKTSKFSESGQLAAFYAFSVAAAFYIISNTNVDTSSIKVLWENYPEEHRVMSFFLKVYYIVQLAYWLHNYPEFYFQKVKRDEMRFRAVYTTLYLVFIAAAYFLNFTRVTLLLLSVHYAAEAVYHVARIAHFTERVQVSRPLWKAWMAAFGLARLLSVILAVITFWYGLRLTEAPRIDPATGNYNTAFIRLNCLLAVCGVQIWLGWNFICAWLRRAREHAPASKRRHDGAARVHAKKQQTAAMGGGRRGEEKDFDMLPEVDQDQVRQRH
jgi:translocating chain-associated membrane protein 1